MATYLTITDSQLDPDAPLTSQLAYQWRDNPLAMFEGAMGAPRLRGEAVAKIADVPILTVTAADTASLALCVTIVAGTLTTTSIANPPTVVARTITVIRVTGIIRLKASHSVSASNGRLSLFKNNVLVQAYSTSGTAARVNDVSAVPGDVFEWRHGTDNSTVTSTFSAASEVASDGYTTITPLIPVSKV